MKQQITCASQESSFHLNKRSPLMFRHPHFFPRGWSRMEGVPHSAQTPGLVDLIDLYNRLRRQVPMRHEETMIKSATCHHLSMETTWIMKPLQSLRIFEGRFRFLGSRKRALWQGSRVVWPCFTYKTRPSIAQFCLWGYHWKCASP